MKILFLGPPCPQIERVLLSDGHEVSRIEQNLELSIIAEHGFEFGISYRYKKIIAQPIIDWFAGRLINLHISYLPWNRGMDPNLWSFLENTPSGVSIHVVDSGLDTGPILLQEQVFMDLECDTLASSWQKLASAIENLFVNNRDKLLGGLITPFKQQGVGSCHRSADKANVADLLIRGWDTPVKDLLNKAGGFHTNLR